jgi:hypothetical protein
MINSAEGIRTSPPVRRGALAAGQQHQHVQVHPHGGRVVGGALRQHHLHHQQHRVRPHRRPARGEHPASGVVVPVVQDPGQQVGVGAGRHLLEEVAADRGQVRAGGDLRPVEQQHVGGRRPLAHRPQQQAGSAAHVDHRGEAGDVVGGHHRTGLPSRAVGHRRAERRQPCRLGRERVEEGLSLGQLERRPAVPHGGEEPGGRPVVEPAAGGHRALERVRHPGPQQLADRAQPEAAVGELVEHLLGGQPTQHPVQGGRARHRAPARGRRRCADRRPARRGPPARRRRAAAG